MKNFLKTITALFLFVVFLGLFGGSAKAAPALIINEFSVAEDTEWIELLNTSSTNTVDLANYKLRILSGGAPVIKELSGVLPKNGFLTFSYEGENILPNDAGLIQITDLSGAVVEHSVSYGTYAGSEVAAPGSGKSAYYDLSDTSWKIGDPTKGWCNTAADGCPNLANIVAGLNTQGVTTNLNQHADMSRASGLFFEKDAYGKITFQKEINLTDSDVATWLQDLQNKLDLDTRGTITLDADLIKELVDTQAALTMFGLSLSNPQILVDGQADDGSVISSLAYNQTTGELNFIAAHFTTFKAIERTASSVSSSRSSSTTVKGCSTFTPLGSPDLFQIDVSATEATLYYSPINTNISDYYISFSEQAGTFAHGTYTGQAKSSGVLSYTVDHLQPNTTYYFMIRGQNDCMAGEWSQELRVHTRPAGLTSFVSFYAYSPAAQNIGATQASNLVSSTTGQLEQAEVSVENEDQEIDISLEDQDLNLEELAEKEVETVEEKKERCFLWWCW